ncbi:multidrug efflux RND transporter permease subunit [Vulcanimicrobium alpinum]|uniref:Multidrug efflux RND transporter permease subunit n=1 Tax=Vulcanimicrobium alpinum TaxID=3016050 RepID=A0AAN1XYB7_UNVUL|nr:efflux RND transporter permease subunit [Vulcanimicrobium alpinum]BDE07194.1 multidrug efflux RND transporter permease subunit [Vulcanimicrobium alpinum]
MTEFFLRRPIFASVASLVILLLGMISIPILPIAQYPNIAPPTVTVTAVYTGASAEAVESSVTTPLEQAINGVQGLRYISSQSGSDGTSQITCTFNLDRNLDQAANDVQNAVNLAQGRLPNEVKLTGVSVAKNSGTFVMAIGVTSTDPRWDPIYMTNYLENNVTNDLKRIVGVSDVLVFGERKYAMRLWVDPKRLADNHLTAGDVVTALQSQNVQVAAGAIGAPPTNGKQPYEYGVRATGRLTNTTEFSNIILRTTADGGFVKVSDIGRVTLGAESYNGGLAFDGHDGIGLGVLQLQSGNALQVSKQVRATLERLSQKFPAGMTYHVAFDTTEFVSESIKEVVITLVIAISLVVLVIFLFLQDWRTTLIPALTIPVSLIGTFFLMNVLGFSINQLTLFGLTLATGLVVDDAIVVIENIARFIQEKGMPPLEGAREAMTEIQGAVVASSLVLLAVFVPVAFFPGTTGQLYKQFALTIACSIAISLFCALTLTPVLSSLLLGRNKHRESRIFRPVNRAIEATRSGYRRVLPRVLAWRYAALAAFAVLLGVTAWAYTSIPTGFIPDEDQGFAIIAMQAPPGVSLDYTHQKQKIIESILKQQPEISDVFDAAGFSFTGNGSNYATMFIRLRPWSERAGAQHTLDAVINRVNMQLFFLPGVQAFMVNPPAIPGLGFQGGFDFQLEDRGNAGIPAMLGAAYSIIIPANAPSAPTSRVYTTFRNDKPTVLVNVDRSQALSLGVPLTDLFNTMQVYLGSVYVNDFDMSGKSYRVYVQADQPYRSSINDLNNIYVRSSTPIIANGAQVLPPAIPISSLMSVQQTKGPQNITHFNLYRSIDITGSPKAGHGSGEALNFMQSLAAHLPPGFASEWSGISREQIESGAQAALIFGLGIVFVFLVLAAQYESFADPLIILFAVPLALLGAIGGLWIRGITSDVFAQVGYVMLIGLASKNAILIVEFANQMRDQGLDTITAVRRAAETRLRPILMTSIAFVLGVTPLVFASGAGSASRHSLGTAVFGGMIVSTILNLVITPVLYVLIAGLEDRLGIGRSKHITRPPDTDGRGTTAPTQEPARA